MVLHCKCSTELKMNISVAIILLFMLQLFQLIKAHIEALRQGLTNKIDDIVQEPFEPEFVNGTLIKFLYWNSNLGNDKPVKIDFGNESYILDYWINGLPIKVITHGWLASDQNFTGVFVIKTAYVDTGGFNVISVDWSVIANDMFYIKPAILTKSVGIVIAEFLNRVISFTNLIPWDIHLIGHSLGAHVMGSCGSQFNKTEKIGRITGLDPACPGFEHLTIQSDHLNIDDAEFVDIIHTSAGSLGYLEPIGHVDIYPNSGRAPQPGCDESPELLGFIICSHSRSYEIYADSIYNKNSLFVIECPRWFDFLFNKCTNNTKIVMGHDTPSSSRGVFYGKTSHSSPFSLS